MSDNEKKSKKTAEDLKQWFLPLINELGDELDKHDSGFALIPFSRSKEEADKAADKGRSPFFVTNLTDPQAFFAALTMAIDSYCAKLAVDPREPLKDMLGYFEEHGASDSVSMYYSKQGSDEIELATDTPDELAKEQNRPKGVVNIPVADLFKDKVTTDDGKTINADDWRNEMKERLCNACDNHDSTYILSIADEGNNGRAETLIAGNMPPQKAIPTLANFIRAIAEKTDSPVGMIATAVMGLALGSNDKEDE